MTIYNIMYILLWGMALISYSKNFKVNQVFFVQVLVLSLFTALRFQTGYDWPVYQTYYNSPENSTISFEIGFSTLITLFKFLGLNFNVFVFFVSVVEILLLAKVIKYFFPRQCVLILAIMFSLADFFLIPMFALMRQGLAVSIFLYGLMLYDKGFFVKAKMLFVLSMLFHLSTIPIIVCTYLVIKLRFSSKTMLIVFALSLLTYLISFDLIGYLISFIIPFIDQKYEMYMQRDTYNASGLYRIVFSAVSVFACFLIYKYGSLNIVTKINKSTLIYALLAVIFPLLFYAYPTISTRYQYFYAIFMIGLSLSLLDYLKSNNLLLVILMMGFLFYVPFYRFITNPLSIVFVPYQNMITYDESNSTGQARTDELMTQLYQLWDK
ncbi:MULTISPECIES: EpsG family protein [Citrobacter]|uniref:EpsG family protein n=1 Tax=Citrobacter TaxID=544 RepID=UPI001C11E70B|nr:EpsG family protein [Citrobacter sp. S55_ASV_140]MBU5604575.1 EpsG family protein [Citrobacter sp. S55_ASV_140]